MKNRWDRLLRECEAADAQKAGKLAPEQFRSALMRTDPKLTTEQKEWCAPPPPPSYEVDTPRPSPRSNRTRRVTHPVLIGHAAGPPGRHLGPTPLPARAVAVSRGRSRVKCSRLIEMPSG